MRSLIHLLLRWFYRYRCFNSRVVATPGPLLLVANHLSRWDWLLVGLCLDQDWRMVIPRAQEVNWVVRRVLGPRAWSIDLNSPFAIRRMTGHLEKGGRLMWFPEGRISRTGSLMKLFEGVGVLLSHVPTKVIVGYLRGASQLPGSPSPARKRWFPRLSLHLSEPLTVPAMARHSAAETRTGLSDWLRAHMVRQQFETELALSPPALPAAIREAARVYRVSSILQDTTLQRVTYRRLLVGAELLAAHWKTKVQGARVGLLLPNVNAFPLALLGVWALPKVPAILNYTLGPGSLLACARLAEVRQIVTSRVFLEHLKLNLEPFRAAGIEFLFLEDARASISGWTKATAGLRALFRRPPIAGEWQAEDPAVVLFTSGSEGEPKGVELTHRNLLANIYQMLSVIDLMESDRFFNALPLFHSFGLTVGLLLPLVRGVFVFLYVSPLHFRVVPSAFYNLDCTVLFGTNTFLAGYARKAHPYDFHRLRYAFAGAEKLQEATFNIWARKFGVRILEGYGATECGPCISVNVPAHPKPGSVGRLLPGIEFKLEPVPGVGNHESTPAGAQAGRLLVRGPNVMRGYLNADANRLFKALDGWYDTGDVIQVDVEGNLVVLGRLKRFAKISGEMISLAAVEDALTAGLSQYGLKFGIAVLTRPDALKGERLIAITNEPRLTLEAVRETIRSRGFSNLAVPREIRLVEELPRLGTGKVDLRELERMVAV